MTLVVVEKEEQGKEDENQIEKRHVRSVLLCMFGLGFATLND